MAEDSGQYLCEVPTSGALFCRSPLFATPLPPYLLHGDLINFDFFLIPYQQVLDLPFVVHTREC